MIAVLSIITVFVLSGFFFWLFLFNIYEIKVLVSPEYLTNKKKSKIEINVVPLNSFGNKAVFREVTAKFSIAEGEDIIENFDVNIDSNRVSIESNGKLGKIVVIVEAEYGLFPTLVEIPVVDHFSDINK